MSLNRQSGQHILGPPMPMATTLSTTGLTGPGATVSSGNLAGYGNERSSSAQMTQAQQMKTYGSNMGGAAGGGWNMN